MSLSSGFTWSHKGLRLVGYSVAGVSTSITMPDADVCFDIAQGLPYQMQMNNLLITHGHLDHCAGLPYLIGQKAMMGHLPPQVYMPSILCEPMKRLMRIWGEVENHHYDFNFRSPTLNDEIFLTPPYFFKVFKTHHRVPSQGYTVFERKKKIKEEYSTLDRLELVNLKKQGVEIENLIDTPLVSFTGDTTIDFLDTAPPWVKSSKVLMLETTFIDKQKSIDNAREWGHLHLDELVPRLDELKCEKILLIHISARYTTPYIKTVLEDRIPEHYKGRVEIFPRPL